jgi:hypothetical protein
MSSSTSTSVTVVPTNEGYNNALAWSNAASLTFNDLATVSDSQVTEMMSHIGSLWAMSEIDFSMIEKFVYDGFDYRALQKTVAFIHKSKKLTYDQLKDVISKALAIHQLTGNMTDKRFKSLSGPGKEMVNTVNGILNIKMGKKQGLTRTELTYPRIGALFPFPLSVIANTFPKDFASKYNTTQLPNCMKTSSFPSLIPTSQPYTTLLRTAYTAYSIDMTVALSGKDYLTIKPEELTQIASRQQKFSDYSHNSGVLDHNERVRAMRALRMDNADTHARLVKVATSFGVTGMPSVIEWTQMFATSYAAIVDSTGIPLGPLPGVALSSVKKMKEPEPEPPKTPPGPVLY